jgi:intein/homing endonuclease
MFVSSWLGIVDRKTATLPEWDSYNVEGLMFHYTRHLIVKRRNGKKRVQSIDRERERERERECVSVCEYEREVREK